LRGTTAPPICVAMKHHGRVGLALLISGSSAACAGVFPNDAEHEGAAFRNVQQRIAFDLGCNDARVVRLGDVARLGQQMTRINVGARCGEKNATYAVTCVSNWGDITCTPELNSSAK
jgi:hypothetical protein